MSAYNPDEFKGMYMEDIIQKLSGRSDYGAYSISADSMHPEIAGIKYSELYYSPMTENPWACVQAGGRITLWIIPK